MRALLILACLPLSSQVTCVVTPESLLSAKAGSLPVVSVGTWLARCSNDTPTAYTLTPAKFAIVFHELHQIGPNRVQQIFAVAQKKSKKNIAAQIFGYAAELGLAFTSLKVVKISAVTAAALGIGSTELQKLSARFLADVPNTQPYLGDQFTVPVTLAANGGECSFTVYASLMHGATDMVREIAPAAPHVTITPAPPSIRPTDEEQGPAVDQDVSESSMAEDDYAAR